jgi:hypothetical protein
MTDFGEIKPVDIRDMWPNEATDFTPWLVDNIDRLGQALGMEIEVQELLGDNDVETTMIHSHVLRRARAGVRSLSSRFELPGGGFYADPYKTPS